MFRLSLRSLKKFPSNSVKNSGIFSSFLTLQNSSNFHTLSNINHNLSLINTKNEFNYLTISKRFKRGTKKKRHEEEMEIRQKELEKNPDIPTEPEINIEFNLTEIQKQIQDRINKLSQQLTEIQSISSSKENMSNLRISFGRKYKKLSDLCEINIRGNKTITLLCNNENDIEIIINNFNKMTADYNPRIEKSGLIVLDIPKPEFKEIKILYDLIKSKCKYCIDDINKFKEKYIKNLNKYKKSINNRDYYTMLNALQEVIERNSQIVKNKGDEKVKELGIDNINIKDGSALNEANIYTGKHVQQNE